MNDTNKTLEENLWDWKEDEYDEEGKKRLRYLQKQKESFKSYLDDQIEKRNLKEKFQEQKWKVWEIIQNKLNDAKSADEATKAITINSIIALCTSITQIIIGTISWSISIMSSWIDSFLEFWLWMFNIFLLKTSQKSDNEKFNYWYWKLQWFWALIQGIIILIFGIGILKGSITNLITGKEIHWLIILMWAILLDIVWTIYAVIMFKKVLIWNKNLIIEWVVAKAWSWLAFNWWIFIWLLTIYIWKNFFWYKLYFIDPIIWIIVAIYVLVSSRELLSGWYWMLMDISMNEEDTKKTKAIIDSFSQDYNNYDNFKSRVSWTKKFIEFNLYFNQDIISLVDAYWICLQIKEYIEWEIEDAIVNIHPLPVFANNGIEKNISSWLNI